MNTSTAIQRFLAAAQQFSLSSQEKIDCRAMLEARIMLTGVEAISLHPAEKEAGRNALQAMMHLHPVHSLRPSLGEVLFSMLTLRLPALALSALIVALGSGVFVAAAESSLPGGVLYGLKVNVVEPLRETMLLSQESKVAWNIRRIERRLGEAQRLATSGRLSREYREVIEQRIAEQVVKLARPPAVSTDVETHIAAQKVLVETVASYEDVLATPSMLSAAAEKAADTGGGEIEVHHLVQFLRERRTAANRHVREILETSSVAEEPTDIMLLTAPAQERDDSNVSTSSSPPSLEKEDRNERSAVVPQADRKKRIHDEEKDEDSSEDRAEDEESASSDTPFLHETTTEESSDGKSFSIDSSEHDSTEEHDKEDFLKKVARQKSRIEKKLLTLP